MNREVDVLSERFRLADEKGLCPECGAPMNETDRLNENGSIFVWLRCDRDGCDGSWLGKASCLELRSA
jgi:hypothetical protein